MTQTQRSGVTDKLHYMLLVFLNGQCEAMALDRPLVTCPCKRVSIGRLQHAEEAQVRDVSMSWLSGEPWNVDGLP